MTAPGDVLIDGIQARLYWPIAHTAALIHHRRRDGHTSSLDSDGFCMRCWSDATRRVVDEAAEIHTQGTLFAAGVPVSGDHRPTVADRMGALRDGEVTILGELAGDPIDLDWPVSGDPT